MRLAGKVAIITGASRGLGKATAFALALEGASVIVAARSEHLPTGRTPGTIEQTVQEIQARGGVALGVRTDLADPAQVDRLVQRALDEFGGVDIVVHNAAAAHFGRLVDTPLRRWDMVWNVNARSTMGLIAGCYPSMKERGGGHFVIVTQRMPIERPLGGQYVPVYRLSKTISAEVALIAAEEGKTDGVAANVIWPGGPRDTYGGRTARGGSDAARGLHPSLFADAVTHLVTQDPRTATGLVTTDEEVLRIAGVTDFSKYEPITESPEF